MCWDCVGRSVPRPRRCWSAGAGKHYGLVADSSAAILPGVTVEATSPALIEQMRGGVTDGAGRYAIIDLRPGTYTVTFSLPGFKTVRREGIVLEGRFRRRSNVELSVGAVEETVTVSGQSPVVDVQSTQTQFVANRQILDALPAGRTTYGGAALVPGVVLYTPQGGLAVMTVHGSANGDQRITFEGMQIGQILVAGGGQTSGVSVNELGQTEVVYTAGTQSAESPTAGVTDGRIPRKRKHIFRRLAHVRLDGWFQNDNVTPELRTFIKEGDKLDFNWDTNAAVGGPLRKNRLWYFAALRLSQTNTLVANTFFPDGRQADTGGHISPNATVRLTYQATPRNKIRVAYYRQPATLSAPRSAPVFSRGRAQDSGADELCGQAKWCRRSLTACFSKQDSHSICQSTSLPIRRATARSTSSIRTCRAA